MVDASVAIKWFVEEPDSAAAARLLRDHLSAPDLLVPECANILWKKVACGELSLDEAEVIATALEGAAITLHPMRVPSWGASWSYSGPVEPRAQHVPG